MPFSSCRSDLHWASSLTPADCLCFLLSYVMASLRHSTCLTWSTDRLFCTPAFWNITWCYFYGKGFPPSLLDTLLLLRKTKSETITKGHTLWSVLPSSTATRAWCAQYFHKSWSWLLSSWEENGIHTVVMADLAWITYVMISTCHMSRRRDTAMLIIWMRRAVVTQRNTFN